MIRVILALVSLFLPWLLRRYFLRIVFKYDIHPSARIGFSLILCQKLVMKKGSSIGNLTICKAIDGLHIGENSSIGALNFITGFPSANNNHFQHVKDRRCQLVIGVHSAITSRHFLDCNGGIFIGDFTTVGGIRSQFLTHSIDVYECRQDCKPTQIGKYCFVGSGVILLPGASLPDYCILGAGSVLTKNFRDCFHVFAGVPARPVKELKMKEVPYFSREVGHVK